MDLLCLHALLVLLCSILLYFSLYSTLSNETLKVMVPPRRSGRSNKGIYNRNSKEASRALAGLTVNTRVTNSHPYRPKNHAVLAPTESKQKPPTPKRKVSKTNTKDAAEPTNNQNRKIPKPKHPENPNSASGVAPPATDVTFHYCLSTTFSPYSTLLYSTLLYSTLLYTAH